jgi:hypothetical protein
MELMDCNNEILGVKTLLLYENNGVTITRPDIATENEINVSTTGETVLIENLYSPKWSQTIDYSGNYNEYFTDTFKFNLQGIDDVTIAKLYQLIDSRVGFLVELTTVSGDRFFFDSPVFVLDNETKKANSQTWEIELTYRVPTLKEYLNVIDQLYYYLQFDGVNEYITFPSSKADFSFIQNTGIYALSCWIKLGDYASGNVERIMSTFGGFTANKGMVLFYEDRSGVGTGTIRFYSSRGAGGGLTVHQFQTVDNSINDNNWHHISVTSDNSVGKIYIDGVDTSLQVDTLSTLSTGDSFTDMIFANDGSLIFPSEMSLDEISVYNEYLTSSNVLDIYNLGRKNPNLTGFSGLVNHWRMDNINPIDIIGAVNGTGVNIDASNIIEWN